MIIYDFKVRVIIRFTFKKSSGIYVEMVDREKNREIIWVSHFKKYLFIWLRPVLVTAGL